MRSSRLGSLVFIVLLTAACGGSTDTSDAAGTTTGAGGGTGGSGGAATTTTGSTTTSAPDIGMPSDKYPAPHQTPPQVVDYGGPVLASPRIVPVFFSNDDPTVTAKLADFLAKVGATQYWAANTTEYGVGPATSTDPVQLTETITGTIDDAAIQTWLLDKLQSDPPAFPAADGNTVYVLHYPAGVTITDGMGGGQSCQSFGGYHSNVTLDAAHGGIDVAYAVIPRCDSFGELSGIDAVTGAESHELLEAATDPHPMTKPAYASVDQNHFYWQRVLGGSETGDMCAQFPGVFTKFAELPYTVQRSWSNKAAKAGHDPCVPALQNEVYFNAVPVLTDTVTSSIGGQTFTTKGVKIAVGESRTIDLDLYSDGDTGGPWDVEVQDISALTGGTPHLSFDLDASSGQNGQKLHLTITVDSAGKHNTETFIVKSTLNGQLNLWVGLVGN